MLAFFRRFFDRMSIARAARHNQYLIHKVRRTWTASGVSMKNQDLGTWDIPNVTRDEAMKFIAERVPHSAIVHVCDVHWIITYRV